MSKKNFTISTVATAPSPATTGTSLVVASGTGSLFAVNEPAIVFPANGQPLAANAEIVMVTNVAADTLTITRAQEGTNARTIVEGDTIIQGITAKDWNDLVTAVDGKITAFADPNADRIVFWDDSAGAFAALTASTGLTLSGTTLTVRSASETATGIVERATDAEFTGGTDTTRFVNAKQVASVAQTMANKTLTSPVINTGVSGTAILDEDDMVSNSDTKLATQQSIKAYVDAKGYTWKGSWVTSTPYSVNDTVESNGSGYVCTTAHTSGASTEPGVGASWASYWDLFVEGTDKTMPTGDIVGTTDTQTLTNKTLTSPKLNEDVVVTVKASELNGLLTGWIPAGETWTYVSTDDPTGVIKINANVTSKYSEGMRFKMTNGGHTIYAIITKMGTYGGNEAGYTYITFLHEIDPTDNLALHLMANSAITNPYYSTQKAPQGFPLSPLKWTVEKLDTSRREQSNPSNFIWYNLGTTNCQLSIPIGVWNVYWSAEVSASGGTSDCEVLIEGTLSTANNSETSKAYSSSIYMRYLQTGLSGNGLHATLYKGFPLEVTSKTLYYLNGMLYSSVAQTRLSFEGSETTTIIRATCAYL